MKKINEALTKLYKKGTAIYLSLMTMIISQSIAASASNAGGGSGVAAFDNIVNLILPWVARMGGIIIIIGGIMWGLGFKSEDAEGQTRGIRTLISGAIVTAIGVTGTGLLG